MQIYGIYLLYRNIQIYLELNRCTIIYGDNFCCCLFVFLTIFLAANASSEFIFAEKWPRLSGDRSIEVK